MEKYVGELLFIGKFQQVFLGAQWKWFFYIKFIKLKREAIEYFCIQYAQ